jgi:hypothetical protein
VRTSADFSGVPITERPIEQRCCAVWVNNIEPGLVVACVILEDGRAIKQGANHPKVANTEGGT